METGSRISLAQLAKEYTALLEKHYEPGFGVSPAAEPHENFYRQVWTRDFAHAAAHHFLYANPQAVEDSLTTILRNQRQDGALPTRVEKEFLLLKLVPGLRFLAKPLFELIEVRLKGRRERPVYSGQDFSFAEDTVPATLVVAEMYCLIGERGERFVSTHADALERARAYTARKTAEDGLLVVSPGNVDWADSITRGGKLGLLNVLWVKALERSGGPEYEKARASLMEILYDKEGGYFRAAEGEDRLDAVATIWGALFFLNAEDCVRAEEAIRRRVRRAAGIGNFDPKYSTSSVRLPFKLIGHGGYHNEYVWPWVTLQYIHVKIKIAQDHQDSAVREAYRTEAVADLKDSARLFHEAGGAYEIFFPDTRKPADTRFYHPPRCFMASMAGYMSAYRKLRELGWIGESD